MGDVLCLHYVSKMFVKTEDVINKQSKTGVLMKLIVYKMYTLPMYCVLEEFPSYNMKGKKCSISQNTLQSWTESQSQWVDS